MIFDILISYISYKNVISLNLKNINGQNLCIVLCIVP